jgi:hypothetical protein
MNTYCLRICAPVRPKDVNVRPGSTAYYCIYLSSAPIWIGGKHIPRAKCDIWWDVVALLHSRVNEAHHGMASKGPPLFTKFKTSLSAGKILVVAVKYYDAVFIWTCVVCKKTLTNKGGSAHCWISHQQKVPVAGQLVGLILQTCCECYGRNCWRNTLQMVIWATFSSVATCLVPTAGTLFNTAQDTLPKIRYLDGSISSPVDSKRLKYPVGFSWRSLAANILWCGWRRCENVS